MQRGQHRSNMLSFTGTSQDSGSRNMYKFHNSPELEKTPHNHCIYFLVKLYKQIKDDTKIFDLSAISWQVAYTGINAACCSWQTKKKTEENVYQSNYLLPPKITILGLSHSCILMGCTIVCHQHSNGKRYYISGKLRPRGVNKGKTIQGPKLIPGEHHNV